MPLMRQVVTNTLYATKGLYGRKFEDPEVLFEEFEDLEGSGSTKKFFCQLSIPLHEWIARLGAHIFCDEM